MSVTIKISELDKARKKLAAQRRVLEEQERAIRIVEQMLQEDNQPDLLTAQGSIQVKSSIQPATFAGAVRHAISELGNQEFRVEDVEEFLTISGTNLPNSPRSRIAMIIQDLVRDNLLERTFEGTGRTPNRYKKKFDIEDLL